MPDTLNRLKAALADRYALQRELGRGGMATVYLAEDLKHHRPVTLKVLRPELAAALGPDRFLREIDVTAGLLAGRRGKTVRRPATRQLAGRGPADSRDPATPAGGENPGDLPERLNIHGEWTYELYGLGVPPTHFVGQLEAYDAIALFVKSAQRIRPDFRATGEDEPS